MAENIGPLKPLSHQDIIDLSVKARGLGLIDIAQALTEMNASRAFIDDQIRAALDVALEYGSIDGAHHKQWVIDRMVRYLTGAGYADFVRDAKAGVDGPDTHEWDVGIAP